MAQGSGVAMNIGVEWTLKLTSLILPIGAHDQQRSDIAPRALREARAGWSSRRRCQRGRRRAGLAPAHGLHRDLSARGVHFTHAEGTGGTRTMGLAEGAAIFVGVPAGVLLLIALPIFGPVWWRAARGRSPESEVMGPAAASASGDADPPEEPEGGSPTSAAYGLR